MTVKNTELPREKCCAENKPQNEFSTKAYLFIKRLFDIIMSLQKH